MMFVLRHLFSTKTFNIRWDATEVIYPFLPELPLLEPGGTLLAGWEVIYSTWCVETNMIYLVYMIGEKHYSHCHTSQRIQFVTKLILYHLITIYQFLSLHYIMM